jgi:hypothetical protein
MLQILTRSEKPQCQAQDRQEPKLMSIHDESEGPVPKVTLRKTPCEQHPPSHFHPILFPGLQKASIATATGDYLGFP